MFSGEDSIQTSVRTEHDKLHICDTFPLQVLIRGSVGVHVDPALDCLLLLVD